MIKLENLKLRNNGVKPASKPISLRRQEALWAYIFISPWLIGFVIFTLGPMLASLVLSLTRYNVTTAPVFIQFDNYIKLFTGDPKFWHSLQVTATYALVAIPMNLILGFALAFPDAIQVPLNSSHDRGELLPLPPGIHGFRPQHRPSGGHAGCR